MLLPSVNILQDLTGKGRESECKRKAMLYLLALRRSLGVRGRSTLVSAARSFEIVVIIDSGDRVREPAGCLFWFHTNWT